MRIPFPIGLARLVIYTGVKTVTTFYRQGLTLLIPALLLLFLATILLLVASAISPLAPFVYSVI